ncbi:MAG: Crp/Fnr family transcriptional regulator [Acidobacteria bacterium]|nr:Crp/Fnr family transcriptional regulator [Acidobacteriota bacterium]
MTMEEYPFEFPPGQHQDCVTLTELTIEHLPHDGSLGQILEFAKGDYAWRPEDIPDRIYFLQHGKVAIFVSDPEGREVVLQIIDAGESFGELCFCGANKLRGSTAQAAAPSSAVAVGLADFMNFMQSNRKVLAALVWTYCIRLADAQRRIEILANRRAEERLGYLLLHLVASQNQKYGQPAKESDEAMLSISHNELAQMAAMSRPHVSVTMNKLRQRAVLDYGRNRPLIVNVRAMSEYLTGQ